MAKGYRNRIVGTGEENPADLVPNPKNWRAHPDVQQLAMSGALAEVGWVQQVVVNRKTGRLVDGHLRVELALSKGEATVPVLYVELTAKEEELVLATLDPISAMATANTEKLGELLGSLSPSSEALQDLLADLSGHPKKTGRTESDDVPDVPDAAVTSPGDVWTLGDHRLICGDATDPAALETLMEGERARVLFTDPPYGVAYEGKTSAKLRLRNDDLGGEGTRSLVTTSLLALAPHLAPGASWYICAPAGNMELYFRLALDDAGFQLRQALVWVKDAWVLGRMDFHWRHESLLTGRTEGEAIERDPEEDEHWRHQSILYGWRSGSHEWNGGRKQDTVWEVPRPRRSTEHPTMKPVELSARATTLSSNAGEVVLDPFVGSGSTLIAAELLERRCRAVEIDPRYCDVVVQRWEEFTGGKATRGTS